MNGVRSTQIYTQVSLRQLRAIHAATHPGASNAPRRHRNAEGDRHNGDAGHGDVEASR
jgi:hypothetical protein